MELLCHSNKISLLSCIQDLNDNSSFAFLKSPFHFLIPMVPLFFYFECIPLQSGRSPLFTSDPWPFCPPVASLHLDISETSTPSDRCGTMGNPLQTVLAIKTTNEPRRRSLSESSKCAQEPSGEHTPTDAHVRI